MTVGVQRDASVNYTCFGEERQEVYRRKVTFEQISSNSCQSCLTKQANYACIIINTILCIVP